MTPAQLQAMLDQQWTVYLNDPVAQATDHAIEVAVAAHPGHDDLAGVIIKASLIDRLYSTSVFAIVRMAQHIATTPLAGTLANGDATAVVAIATGHGILNQHGHERRFPSFASKYATFHHPSLFPAYDRLVIEMLGELNLRCGFMPGLTRNALVGDYASYRAAFDALMGWGDLARWAYRSLEKRLWLLAKAVEAGAVALPAV